MTRSTSRPPHSPRALWSAVGLWFATVVWASLSGALAEIGMRLMPAFALLVALGIAIPVALHFAFPAVRHQVDVIGLHRLTLMHVWRIPAALVFFYYGVRGQLPPLFWVVAGVGDLCAGSYAATLLWREPSIELYRRIHRFGLADFVAAVALGLGFTLMQDPRMTLLTTLPMALIPLFGVGLSGASHVIALNKISKLARS